jgi:hypothetical protein
VKASAKSRLTGMEGLSVSDGVLSKPVTYSYAVVPLPSVIQKCESCRKEFTARRGLNRCQDCQNSLNAWLDNPKTPEKTALVGVEVDKGKTTKRRRSLPVRNMLTQSEIGWLAGFIDGEGWIGWHNSKRQRPGREPWIEKYPIVTIYQSDKPVLELIRALLGFGKVYQIKRYKSSSWAHKKTPYRLMFSSKQSRQLLVLIEPYLIVKRQKVREILGEEKERGRL